jgi:hypothetical protein
MKTFTNCHLSYFYFYFLVTIPFHLVVVFLRTFTTLLGKLNLHMLGAMTCCMHHLVESPKTLFFFDLFGSLSPNPRRNLQPFFRLGIQTSWFKQYRRLFWFVLIINFLLIGEYLHNSMHTLLHMDVIIKLHFCIHAIPNSMHIGFYSCWHLLFKLTL